jgi:hypothetical protein
MNFGMATQIEVVGEKPDITPGGYCPGVSESG